MTDMRLAEPWHRRMRREVQRGLGRFRRASPLLLPGTLWRALRLRGSDPLPRPAPARPERIVVAMTTIPERAGRAAPALRSLIDQSCPADRVLLAYPSRSWRTGAPYPPPPILPAGVELLSCEDVGPATKLLPALRAEPHAAIVVTDDDVIYPVDFIETLLRAHRADPAAVVGLRGVRLEHGADPRELVHIFGTAVAAPTEVDILFGTWGYLVPPGALDETVHDFSGYPPEVRWNDDIWISGHLARRGVARKVVPARRLPIETSASPVAALTYGPNASGHNDRVGIEAFAQWWHRP